MGKSLQHAAAAGGFTRRLNEYRMHLAYTTLVTLDFHHVEHDLAGVLPTNAEIFGQVMSGCSKSCSPSTNTRLGASDFNPFH